jgi:hypothetical protein
MSAPIPHLALGEVRVKLHLVHRGRHFRLGDKFLQVTRLEVADANCAHAAIGEKPPAQR